MNLVRAVRSADSSRPLLRIHQPCSPDVLFGRPARGAVQVIGVLHQLPRTPTSRDKEQTDASATTGEDDHLSEEQWLSHARVLRSGVVPAPDNPSKGLIDAADFGADERRAECRLVSEFRGDELRSREIHNGEHQEAEAGGTPVVPTEVSGLPWRAIELRLPAHAVPFTYPIPGTWNGSSPRGPFPCRWNT